MALNARLTSDEADAVTEFLVGAARRLSMADQRSDAAEPALLASNDPAFIPRADGVTGAEIYTKQCAACHGKEGKGDGPAAAALTPRPPDLTDASKMGELSDEELFEIIARGKGAMPGFDALLEPEELKAVTEFVRRLSSPEEQ
jgi:mono/diheme cytochrome c family protein